MDEFITGCVIGLLTGALITFIIMCVIAVDTSTRFHNQAINKGFAEYNQTSGLWQWKEVEKIENKGK